MEPAISKCDRSNKHLLLVNDLACANIVNFAKFKEIKCRILTFLQIRWFGRFTSASLLTLSRGVGARFFAGILAKRIGSERGGTERGTIQAWRMMIILHLIASAIFVGYLCFRALPRVEDWTETLWHLVSFLPFLVVDVCLLISLASLGPKKQKKRQ